MSSLLGNDPWVAIVTSDPRAALAGGGRLRGAERRVDGPFVIRDGKAGTIPVSIVTAEPGGPGAWFAATRLALRRFAPSLIVGVAATRWLGETQRPDYFASTEVMDLAPAGPVLRETEATATGALPERIRDRLRSPDLPVYRSTLDLPGLLSKWGDAKPAVKGVGDVFDDREKAVEKGSDLGLLAIGSRPETGRLGCWGPGPLESRAVGRWLAEAMGVAAVDPESAGLAEAADEDGVPWVVLGPCLPFEDPFAAGPGREKGGAGHGDDPATALARALESVLTILAVHEDAVS